MNFRVWEALAGYTNSLIQRFSKGCLLRRKIIQNTRLRCDFHFLGLGCVHECVLLAVRNEPHLCARDTDLDIAEAKQPHLPLFPFGFISFHKGIEDLEFDSSWVTKMKWGDAY